MAIIFVINALLCGSSALAQVENDIQGGASLVSSNVSTVADSLKLHAADSVREIVPADSLGKLASADSLTLSPADSLKHSVADSLNGLTSADTLMVSTADSLKVCTADSLCKLVPADSLGTFAADSLCKLVPADSLGTFAADSLRTFAADSLCKLVPADSLGTFPADSLNVSCSDCANCTDSVCAAFTNALCATERKDTTRTIFAVKSNLLYDLVTVVNYSLEVPIGERVSLLAEHYIPWWLSKDNKYCLQLQSVGFEGRFWIKPHEGKRLSGHFVGAYGLSGTTDLQYDRELNFQAKFWSAGLTYGYSFILNNSLRLELSIAGGYLRAPLTYYIPSDDYSILFRDLDRNEQIFSWWGPVKAHVSLVWSINAPRKAKKGGER